MSPHRLGDRGCLWPVGWLRGSWGRRARRCPEAASATASPRPMHPAAAAGRCLSSVSDLCGVDEIDALLDEIRDLEPASCCPEEFQPTGLGSSTLSQDFEIAGSRSAVLDDCQTPGSIISARSWDSHANYRPPDGSAGGSSGSLYSDIVLYWDESAILSIQGLLRILLLLCSIACLACLCSSGTVHVGLFMLPLIGRLRLMMFVTVFTVLVTCLLLFLDISHLAHAFPFNWAKLNAAVYLALSLLYLASSSLILDLLRQYYGSHAWVPRWTRQQLLVTSILGFCCAVDALALSILAHFRCGRDGGSTTSDDYRPVSSTELLDAGGIVLGSTSVAGVGGGPDSLTMLCRREPQPSTSAAADYYA